VLAKDIMSKPVISVEPETPVPEAAALLARHRISGVPVLEGGRLVGVVNEWDLMHRQEIGTEQVPAIGPWWRRLFRADKAPAQYVKSHATRVRDIMTREVASVVDSVTLSHIAVLFDARHIRRLPVLTDGKVVGIITRANLVNALVASTQGSLRPSERTDNAIRSELLTELARQPWWRPEWSAVTVIDGVVQFRGLIDTRDEIRAGRVAAERVPGVRGVEDFRQRYGDLAGL